jgi:molybdopterin-dependent oxidoreductase alpha subunit
MLSDSERSICLRGAIIEVVEKWESCRAMSPGGIPMPPEVEATAVPEAECPEVFTGLSVTPAKTVAAGLPAVVSSMKHVWGQAGVLRGTRILLSLNQDGGIDCPSCAWPDPDDHRSRAEFCENGAKAVAWEADRRRLTAEFFQSHALDDLARLSDYELGQLGRLTEPLVLRPGSRHYEPITWDDAFALIAEELNGLDSPDEAAFYTSGRTSNEAAFLYQLFVRQFGTNNLPDCSNMCHESSGVALSQTVGIGKGTVKLEDFEKAELILILGQNPGTNHPRMLTALQKAKRAGARIVAINPLREAGLLAFHNPQELGGMTGVLSTPLADHYLQVKLGGDQALLKGVMKLLIDHGQIDQSFIRDQTEGFEALQSALPGVSWEDIVEQSGINRAEIETLAGLIGSSSRIIACWAMGLTQHKHAVATIQDLVNVILLRGSIGKPGAGLCPVRGHSNVQGDRTMGIWEHPPAWLLDNLQKEFHFEPPRQPGLDTVHTIRAMLDHKVKVFFALGGNFLSATPDTLATAQALKQCRLTAHVSIKLNRSHLVTGRTAVILPCLGRTERDMTGGKEQFVTTENSMGVVQRSQGTLAPASEHLRSEVSIVAHLAQATLGKRSTVPWLELAADYDRIRDRIERVIPGFDNYNQRVRQPGGFYLPNKPRDGQFPTPVGKARFTVTPLPDLQRGPGQLAMMTIRTHDQFNTTVYGLDDRYRGIYHERRVILMNADDLKDRGLQPGDVVDLISHFEGETRRANRFITVAYDIPRGCTATYFPEANVLVPLNSIADHSHTPTSKYVLITVERSQ